ncbi:hypothetical protein [Paenibacillus sp. IHBB 10380]|uniref:hypothetical protein n=1 Tax=Paenibacillus sp. IHBB 10380 TaxID=1566358 RepID=UPI0005CF9BFC|nr:hypothetical protein [Paenibacillus sp. IHBB 10380]AJS57674.1 hypothetical protein UB51_03290 [Paenibacillus sp. IHBB 10380]
MMEKNILAYFKSPEQADGVARKLQSLRIVDMSIDRFGDAGTATATTITSEWSNGGYDDVTKGYDILLTLVLEESSLEPAKRIIEEAGGMI